MIIRNDVMTAGRQGDASLSPESFCEFNSEDDNNDDTDDKQ